MMHKSRQMPPTMVPVGSAAGQKEMRLCDCCQKLQPIAEGFEIRSGLCRQCVEAFDEPITQSDTLCFTWRPGWWWTLKNWLRGRT